MDTRLLQACVSGDLEALQELIEQDPLILDTAVTCCEATPLHVAVLRGHLSIVAELLRLEPELVSEKDASGCVPLHLASAKGSLEIVSKLLSENAYLWRARDHCDRTPLHLGVMKGRLEVVRELIRVCPESASERLGRGETVFHLSIRYCRLETLELLVELLHGDPRQLLVATDDDGNSVLHFAAIFKQIQTVKYLVSLEEVIAIANEPNGDGHTALDEVMKKSPRDFNSFEIVETLIQFGVGRSTHLTNNPTIVVQTLPPTTANSAVQIPSLTTTNPVHTHTSIGSRMLRWYLNLVQQFYWTYQEEWIASVHGNLMVVATVIASMSFQTGINPPGGVWQEDRIDNHTCTKPDMCIAGTAVLKHEKVFHSFYTHNTWALMAALGFILLHFVGYPLKNKVGTWLVTLTMCVMLHNILGAYLYSTKMVIGNFQYKYAHVWGVMLFAIASIHSTRIWCWLMMDKVPSFVTSVSILRRYNNWFLWIRAVATVGGVYGMLFVLIRFALQWTSSWRKVPET